MSPEHPSTLIRTSCLVQHSDLADGRTGPSVEVSSGTGDYASCEIQRLEHHYMKEQYAYANVTTITPVLNSRAFCEAGGTAIQHLALADADRESQNIIELNVIIEKSG